MSSYDDGYYDATKGTLVMDFDRWDDDQYVQGFLDGKKGLPVEAAAAITPYGGGDNPFTPGGAESGGRSSGGVSDDPQMDTSLSGGTQGDAISAAPADTSSNTASLLYRVTCLSCNQQGNLVRVSSRTTCRCGSSDLSYIRFRKLAEFPPKKDDDKSDDDDSKKEPPAAPAAPATDPNAATTGGDPSALKGEDEPGPVVPMIDPATGQPVPVQAPPSEGTGPLPGADPAAAPPTPGAEGAPVPGQPASTDPMDIAQSTLDNVVDQANQLGHDAMETAYDVDQLFSEWRCQNCGQEGRADLSEDGQVAFSGDLLDQPQGCAMPQGDPNAATPVPDVGQDPAAAAQDPAAAPAAPPAPADATAAPAGTQPAPEVPAAPAPPGTPPAAAPAPAAPPADPNAPPPPKKDDDDKKKTSAAKDEPHEEHDEQLRFNKFEDVGGEGGKVRPMASGGLNDFRPDEDQQNPNDETPNTQEKLTQITEAILRTNPGMNTTAAREVAVETLRRFPSITGAASRYEIGSNWQVRKHTPLEKYDEETGRTHKTHVYTETADLKDKRTGNVYAEGAHRVRISGHGAGVMRGKTYKGETAWSHAESHHRDAVNKLLQAGHEYPLGS